MSNRDFITQELLQHLFDYKDGQLFWKNPTSNRKKTGERAGCKKEKGYRFIRINNFLFYEHRIVYMWHFGKFIGKIDHIDGDTFNNKISNLRIASNAENSRNSKKFSTNTSGRKGVSLQKNINKWHAYIGIDGKIKNLGFFKDFDDAVKARENAEKEIFGEFNRVSVL